MSKTLAVSVSEVNVVLGSNQLLKDISLDVNYGEIVGLMGRNGSGKTMLLRCIAGFIPPQSGTILVAGRNIRKNGGFCPEIGFVLDNAGFLPNFSGLKNLKYIAAIRNFSSVEKLAQSMKAVGLDPNDKKKYCKYSQGMKKRLAIAQAIMEDPKILLLDEPMNGLDQDSIFLVYDLIREMASKKKCAIILTSHYPEDIASLCGKVYSMNRGELRLMGGESK